MEIEESDGWTTVYKGAPLATICWSSGELVFLEYNKRWLFTGEYGDQQYERAYFGDFRLCNSSGWWTQTSICCMLRSNSATSDNNSIGFLQACLVDHRFAIGEVVYLEALYFLHS